MLSYHLLAFTLHNMKYNVLKNFEGHAMGDVVDGSEFTDDQVAALIADGSLEPVAVVVETVTADQAYLDANPDMVANGLQIGDEVTVTKAADEEAPDNVVVDETTEDPRYYQGKQVISDGFREVNGITYHHIRLADGSENDMTDDEYNAFVASN